MFTDLEDRVIENFTIQLKQTYLDCTKHIFKSRWPPISAEFTKLGFVIHKPKRTEVETKEFARSASSGHQDLRSGVAHTCDNFVFKDQKDFDTKVTIKEEVSDIFF